MTDPHKSILESLTIYRKGLLVVLIPALLQVCLLLGQFALGSYSSQYAWSCSRARTEVEHLRQFASGETFVLMSIGLAESNQDALDPRADEKMEEVNNVAIILKEDFDQDPEMVACLDQILARTSSLLYDSKRRNFLTFLQSQKKSSAISTGKEKAGDRFTAFDKRLATIWVKRKMMLPR